MGTGAGAHPDPDVSKVHRTPPLRLNGVSVTLGSTRALQGVSLALSPGWTAIVGPNGAGKSTLLRVMAGLLAPHAGEVQVAGRPLESLSGAERATQIAWLAQGGETTGEATVRDLVRLGRLARTGLFGTLTADDEARVDQAMVDAGCTAWRHRRLQGLSGGERQRVLVARALAVGAPLLLLDEPTTHLDPPHQVVMVRLMRTQARAGVTVISVLHDLALALLADRLVVMDAGRVRAEGPPHASAVREAVIEVFGGAIRIDRFENRWTVSPWLD